MVLPVPRYDAAGIYPDATALVQAIQSRQTTSTAALEACLDRIRNINPELNAIVHLDEDGARKAAAQCDAASAPLGVLHGVPVTVKECFDWAGHPTTWGDPARADDIAEQDSDVVTALKRAGAVMVGKTNIPAYLDDWETDNPLFGSTHNPHDHARSAGGSSGGSAAAVASGMSYIDIGSDQGGSIRLPAHCCGVYGLKPSWGSISLRGHSPLGELRQPDIGAAGPLTRSAQDVGLSLEAFGFAQSADAWGLDELTFAVFPTHLDCPIDAAYSASLDQFCKRLRAAGATQLHSEFPFDLTRATEVMNLLVWAETSRKARLVQAFRNRVNTTDQPQNAYGRLNAAGNNLSHHDWLELHEERLVYCERLRVFFEEVDILICPAAAGPAPPLRPGVEVTRRTVPINGQEEPILKQHLIYMMGSLCYLPSLVVPAGVTADGMPVGAQMVGPRGSDLRLAAIAGNLGLQILNPNVLDDANHDDPLR